MSDEITPNVAEETPVEQPAEEAAVTENTEAAQEGEATAGGSNG